MNSAESSSSDFDVHAFFLDEFQAAMDAFDGHNDGDAWGHDREWRRGFASGKRKGIEILEVMRSTLLAAAEAGEGRDDAFTVPSVAHDAHLFLYSLVLCAQQCIDELAGLPR